MSVEPRDPAVSSGSNNKGGKGEMTKAPISLQDLRRSLYVKAKAEPTWRFWGLYVHICKMETLREAYQMAKANDGAPGIDGVTMRTKVSSMCYVEDFRLTAPCRHRDTPRDRKLAPIAK